VTLAFTGVGLGGLLVVPELLAGLFAVWKWKYRSSVRRQFLDDITLRGDELVLEVARSIISATTAPTTITRSTK